MNYTPSFTKLVSLQFKDFTQSDWDGYSGCVSKTPRIASEELENGEYIDYIIEPDTDELIIMAFDKEGNQRFSGQYNLNLMWTF